MAASQSNGATTTANETNKPAARSTPKDALVMSAILREMGISDYEPRVVNQMLEFTYRYITIVLDDAKVYSTHAGKKEIDTDDVQLAIQSRLDHSYSSPPPRDFLIEIARQKNRTPLPQIQPKSGLRLPPDRYCLTGKNYKVRAQKKLPPRPAPITSRTSSAALSVQGNSVVKPATVAHIIRPVMSSVSIATPSSTSTPQLLVTNVINNTVSTNPVTQIKTEKINVAGHGSQTTTGIPIVSAGTLQVRKVEPVVAKGPTVDTKAKGPTGTSQTTKQVGGNPASMMTISALPSMDETVASAQQPLITPQKRKHDDDDDYDV